MNLLLLLSLFLVTLLMLMRTPERVLSIFVTIFTLLGLLVLLSVNLDVEGMPLVHKLERLQGFWVVFMAVLGGAAFAMGTENLSLSRLPSVPKPAKIKQPALQVVRSGSVKQSRASGVSEVTFKDYEVLDRIGVGGMGSVYRARRKHDGRILALKIPQEKYLADSKFVKRFYREAEVLKRFNHPNIVRVYDYRMQAPEHYIAMEFLDGDSLEGLLEEKTLSYTQSIQILKAIADALRHIHMQNVVHRDIKPANVMVLKNAFDDKDHLCEGGVKLMDFGIAVGKVLTRLTMTGARVGTPTYMAPEQAKGSRVDARSDVYSLGLLAYEMVTGETAFKGGYDAVVHQQVFESPKPPKQVSMEIPSKLSDLILAMIEKDPVRRPSLDEVISKIDAGVLEDEPFNDPVAIAMGIKEKKGALRLLDLKGKLRVGIFDLSSNPAHGILGTPNAAAADNNGNLYISILEARQGKGGTMIRKIDASGKEVCAFGTYGLSKGELLCPVSIAVSGRNVYVLDAEAHTVNTYDTTGRYVGQFGGRGRGRGTFDKPSVIAVAPNGEIYVLDSGNNEVQKFSAGGEYISRYAFRLDRSSENLRPIDGLTIDSYGGVYIVDRIAGKIRKIESGGTPGNTFPIETLIGDSSDSPWLMQVSPEGQIYVIRQGGNMLRTFSGAGDLLSSKDMYAPVMSMAILKRKIVIPEAPDL